jgi:glycosyltransferase involved in cell wall biosynthesis
MKEQKPLVSIGCPTYNRPAGLRRMLECLVSQTYSNLEIIVSDNCSTGEETQRVVWELSQQDPRIKYFRQEQNIGLFHNYKFVLEQAQGEYFAWACDDDAREPNFIEACMREFERLETLLVVNSYSQRVDRLGQVIATDRGCTTIGMPPYQRYIQYISTIYTQQAGITDINYGVMKREQLAKAIRDLPNVEGWDHVLFGRLSLDGEFYTIPTVLMTSGASGYSANRTELLKTQKIQGSKSETMPVWVRQICQQKTIWSSPNLNWFEKSYLSIWSYAYYFLTHGIKLWIKRLFPRIYGAVRHQIRQQRIKTTLRN